MKKNIIIGILIIAVLAVIAKIFFLKGGPPRGMGQMPPPVVSLTKVKQRKIIDTSEYIGRIAPKDEVELVPHVQGYLQKKYFIEGEMVNKGDLLFLIEPDEYEAAVAEAKADIENAKAAVWESEKNLERAEELVKRDFISKSEYDNKLALRDKNIAALEAAKAYFKKVNNNFKHTRIYAPIQGKISDIKITEGNLVGPNKGSLATIVRLDPVYVIYNVKSEDFTRLRMKLQKNNKKIDNCRVKIEFPDGTPYPVYGKQDYYDNKVNETTGTIKVRATFSNPGGVLIPGQLVNVIVYEGKGEDRTVIPQAAVLEDPQGKYVYYVDKQGKALQKRITIDGESDTDFIVKEGLTSGEEIILSGIQKIMMPGMKVNVGKPGEVPSHRTKPQINKKGSTEKKEKSENKKGKPYKDKKQQEVKHQSKKEKADVQ